MQLPNYKQGQTPNSEEFDYEHLLERIGFGRTQWCLGCITGLLTLNAISAQNLMGIVAVASQCEFKTTQVEKGIQMVAYVTGIFLSTYIWGYISDAFGRRFVLLYSTFVANLLQLILMFVTNIWFFNCINFAVGISLGGITAAMYAYLGEFNTSRYRAIVINYSTMFVSVTSIYVPAMSWLLLERDWSLHILGDFEFRPWRLLMLVSLVPGFIGALLLLRFPESPKLLLAQDKMSEATRAVEWICRENTGRSVTSLLDISKYTLRPEPLEEISVATQKGCGLLVAIWKSTVPLFHKPHGRNFLICSATFFGLFFNMMLWFPDIVNRSSSATDSGLPTQTVCAMLDSSFQRQSVDVNITNNAICADRISTKTYMSIMTVGLAFLLGFLLQGMLLRPLGKKRVILGALTMSVLSGIMLQFVSNPIIVLVLFCLYFLMPGLSISTMCGAVVELVPTNMRAKAVSVCFTLGRLGFILSTNLVGILMEPACNATFALITATMLVCAVLVNLLPI